MYRILIADDEGIMLESLKSMILKSFPGECDVYTAKSGRAAIEQAKFVHPDIIFMDIEMPGINGIQALKEIRRTNSTALFYIVSAYDKFDYAQEAISLNVEKYLMKPITKKTVIATVNEAMEKVTDMRRTRSDRLKVQEKLETIVPVVENGFISSILTQNDWQETQHFRELLDLTEEYAFICVIQFGSDLRDGHLTGPIGAGVRAQNFYPQLRAVIKSFRKCIIGSILSDRVAAAVPISKGTVTYEERIGVIEETRKLAARLEEEFHLKFRIGIGRVRRLDELRMSYQEAIQALQESTNTVVHTNDIIGRGMYEGDFPEDTEKQLFQCLDRGDLAGMEAAANRFFDWMIGRYPESADNIRLKVLEYVLWAEKDAFREGAVNYGFESRSRYLSDVLAASDYGKLREWFLEKLSTACRSIATRQQTQSESLVEKAKAFIDKNYSREISLDDVSREVNVSPYYFSKLFKEEAGENFIDYLTSLRMEKAKQLLVDNRVSIKEISAAVGYSDPNYFSRIFKKQTEMTPREYRESAGN